MLTEPLNHKEKQSGVGRPLFERHTKDLRISPQEMKMYACLHSRSSSILAVNKISDSFYYVVTSHTFHELMQAGIPVVTSDSQRVY